MLLFKKFYCNYLLLLQKITGFEVKKHGENLQKALKKIDQKLCRKKQSTIEFVRVLSFYRS